MADRKTAQTKSSATTKTTTAKNSTTTKTTKTKTAKKVDYFAVIQQNILAFILCITAFPIGFLASFMTRHEKNGKALVYLICASLGVVIYVVLLITLHKYI